MSEVDPENLIFTRDRELLEGWSLPVDNNILGNPGNSEYTFIKFIPGFLASPSPLLV